MANSDLPRGLHPIKSPGGGEPKATPYMVTSGYAVTIAVGSPVILVNTGYCQILDVTTAASQANIIGVSAEYKAASSATNPIMVWDDPDQLFLIQSAMTTAIAQTHIGATARIVNCTGINTTTQLSEAELDTVGTTTTSALRIIGLHKREGNAFGSHADMIVKFSYAKHMNAAEAGI